MEEFENEYKIAELINKAIKFRDKFDLDNFNKTIQEIDAFEYNQKFEFMKLLFEEEFIWMFDPDYPGYEPNNKEIPNDFEDSYNNLESDWLDKFILNDIEHSYDTLKCLNLLETLMILGKTHDDSFYQNIITSILQKVDVETDEIYYVREYLIKGSFSFHNCVPDCFKLKENEVLPKLEPLTEGTPFFSFIFNKEGLVEFDIHPYYYDICDSDYKLGEDYEKGRIEDNLKLIPQENTLKADFLNCKTFF